MIIHTKQTGGVRKIIMALLPVARLAVDRVVAAGVANLIALQRGGRRAVIIITRASHDDSFTVSGTGYNDSHLVDLVALQRGGRRVGADFAGRPLSF